MLTSLSVDEQQRLDALFSYEILDTPPEDAFDDLAALAAQLFRVPVVLISFVGENREWFKSKIGVTISEIPRAASFGAHAILQPDVFVVSDAKQEPRFAGNVLVAGESRLRFYAGAPLVAAGGENIGVFCVMDRVPRKFTGEEKKALRTLSRQVMRELEGHRLTARPDSARVLEKSTVAVEDVSSALLDKVPTPIWRSGQDAKCDYFNQAWLEFTGRTLAQELGEGWVQGVHPDDVAQCLKVYQEAFDARKPFDMEYRLLRHDGEYRSIVDGGRPFYDRGGHFAGYVGSFYDPTEHRRAKANLAKRETQLAEAQALAHLGSWDWDLITNAVNWSDELYRVFGLKPREFGGTYESFLERVHPEDRDYIHVINEEALLKHQPFSYEYRIRWPDGTVRVIYGQGDVTVNEAGQPVRLFGTAQDITARKQAKEKLRQSADELRVLSRRLVEIQEVERRHFASELHDEVGQTLTLLKFSLDMLPRLPAEEIPEKLGEAQATIHDLIMQVQNLSLELRPSMLDDLGLLPTLLWHFDRFTSKTRIQVDFIHDGLMGIRFPAAVETAAYRIAQEALTNVARHAGVQSVQVQATADERTLRLQISDQGCGFDAASATSAQRSIGLFGMRERARLLDGELTIESHPGAGTRILAELFF